MKIVLVWSELLSMTASETHAGDRCAPSRASGSLVLTIVLVVAILSGCQTLPREGGPISGPPDRQTYTARHLTSEQCSAFLRPLGLEDVVYTSRPEGCVLEVRGTPSQLKRAGLVLEVVDSSEEYCVENVGPASAVRLLPSNRQIATALGDIDIGTFDLPPVGALHASAIVDIQGDSVLAFLPVRYRDRLHMLLAGADTMTLSHGGVSARAARRPGEPNDTRGATDGTLREGASIPPGPPAASTPTVVTLVEMAVPPDGQVPDEATGTSSGQAKSENELPRTVKINLTPAGKHAGDAVAKTTTDKALPVNSEDVLTMTLPETITLIQLLDLVGKYVGLNYVYDPREIGNQSIALKLHGNLQGQMKVKDLYALLETVLQFMNLAMIRQDDGLVAIVPIDKALQTQPELVDVDHEDVSVGDMVITRVFDIEHVDVSSVVTLLQSMKLSVAATPLDNSSLLLVTCHTGRMNRIEQLVEMIDRPGKPAECRFRRLSYVRASSLIAKIRNLAEELGGITVAATPPAAKPGTAAAKPPVAPAATASADKRSVYLDTDERTNRILMVGFEEELTVMEGLVDLLDVAQEDPRSPHLYAIKHLSAQQALEKLQKLEVLKATSHSGATPAEAGKAADVLAGEPLVAVLEVTNQLLVKAAPDQHSRIRELLNYIDATQADTRTIAAYEVRHIDVREAEKAIHELDLVSVDTDTSSFVPGPNQPASGPPGGIPVTRSMGDPMHQTAMVVSESTNSLLVKATPEQHTRIAAIVKYIDRDTPEEELAYRVYPLESSSPDHLASLLERLLMETTKDKDGKIERLTPKTEEQISVVPDPNTFSLIVYANQKNQKRIEGLISRLDKRRPQVLIDVTLVEITRTDSFEYDLSLVGAAGNAVTGNIVIDPIQALDSGSRLEGGFNLMDSDGNPTGRTRAFYSDEHVQALLTAIQRKNYGRVLAKPKVLVDDGRKGQIMTTEATTYVKESIQIPQTGTPITTREFTPIEASIELQITPHISEGNLLRLDVLMSRDDFGSRPLSGAPPDKATSKVTTTVFVPDDRTVILGGLVKLNQSKGGSKVPILGDIPLIGAAFRSLNNSDIERKLYVFLKANIVRPYDDSGLIDLQKISEEHRDAFEQSESEFQGHEDIPGLKPKPMQPAGVLRDYK